jgi:hypothetical protein
VYVNGSYVSGGPTSSGGGSGGSGGGTGGTGGQDIVCPNVPSGYACVTRGGATVPILLNPPGVRTGTYGNRGYDTCLTLSSGGNASYRFSAGYPGGPSLPTSGRWGALVSRNGTVSGTADGRYVYLYTGHPDPQLTVMVYDKKESVFEGFGLRIGGCSI